MHGLIFQLFQVRDGWLQGKLPLAAYLEAILLLHSSLLRQALRGSLLRQALCGSLLRQVLCGLLLHRVLHGSLLHQVLHLHCLPYPDLCVLHSD